MGKQTTINWTTHTFNPWEGCTKVSPGCDHCYAEYWSTHRFHHDVWGKGKPRRVTSDANWAHPLMWDRSAAKSERIDKVFCGSLCDVMDDEAPSGVRERLWRLIDQTPHLIWQLLTKRPHRYQRHLPATFQHDNVWLGVSAENQRFYDIRWPILRGACDRFGCISFISYEPALGPLSMLGCRSFPNWIICGGESGPHYRPMDEKWAKTLRDECRQHDVAFHMKQLSAQTPAKGAALIPAELLIREFPEGARSESKRLTCAKLESKHSEIPANAESKKSKQREAAPDAASETIKKSGQNPYKRLMEKLDRENDHPQPD